MADDLFYYGTYLVDLNGINDKILSFVVIFLGCLLEAVAGFLDTVVQDVGETNQYRGRHVPDGQFVHQFPQIDFHAILSRGYVNVSFFVDSKIVDSPSVDVVQFFGVFNTPFSHYVLYRFNSSRSKRTESFILS